MCMNIYKRSLMFTDGSHFSVTSNVFVLLIMRLISATVVFITSVMAI